MMKKEYLTEENYQNTKKKISFVALIIVAIGVLIGGSLIAKGIQKNNQINSKYSDTAKEELSNRIAQEKLNLENKKAALINKGITYSAFTTYEDGEAYDLYILTKVLDPSFDRCSFPEYENNSLTREYCSLKSQFEEINNDFNKDFDSHDSVPFFMFGGFVILVSCMIGGIIYMSTRRREVLAYGLQSVMPVAQEGLEKMAPTAAKVGKEVMKEMAPAYGEMAKEISKGIKEGLKGDESNK